MDPQPGPGVRGKKNAIEQAYREALGDPRTLILFEDEASFYRQPTCAPVHAPRGGIQPRCRLAHRSNGCVRAAVAFDAVHGGMSHLMRTRFTATALGAVYRQVSQWTRGAARVCLVMDNWPVHRHPRAWKAIEEDDRLRVLWLPTYSPWLNPAEKVWKWVRQRRIHMHGYCESLPELGSAIDRTVASAGERPEEMLRYTGTGNGKLYST